VRIWLKILKLVYQCATISDEPVVLLDLWLTIYTSLLSLLFIESSSGSEEGGGNQQMTPELLNEAFSAKVT
jgi:hypothetical protein